MYAQYVAYFIILFFKVRVATLLKLLCNLFSVCDNDFVYNDL